MLLHTNADSIRDHFLLFYHFYCGYGLAFGKMYGPCGHAVAAFELFCTCCGKCSVHKYQMCGLLVFSLNKIKLHIKFKVLVVPNGFMTRRVCIIWGKFFNVFLSDPWERCSLVSMVSGDSFVIMTMQIGQD